MKLWDNDTNEEVQVTTIPPTTYIQYKGKADHIELLQTETEFRETYLTVSGFQRVVMKNNQSFYKWLSYDLCSRPKHKKIK